MANSKKNDTKKIMDVAHPNTSPAPSSSRPVIVTNRPIMKDPTVVEDTPSTPIQVKTIGEKKIEPLSAPELPIEEAEAQIDKHKAESAKKAKEDEPQPVESPQNNEPEPETKAEETEENEQSEAAPKEEEAVINDGSTSSLEESGQGEEDVVASEAPEEPSAGQEEAPKEDEPQPVESPQNNEPELETKAEETEEDSEKAPAQEGKPTEYNAPQENISEDKDKDLGSVTGANEVKDAEKIEAEEAAKQAEHEEKIQKLVDSKQYYLPINSVEKRKSRRFVSLGILLSLLLVVAWADIALDAGLINISTNLPHTHFFSTNASSTISSLAAPVAIPTPSSPADKQAASQISSVQKLLAGYASINHSYPSDISQATLQPELDSTAIPASVLTPPNGTKFVYAVFPSSCTTQAGNCSRYLLKAETKGGDVISSLHQ